MNIVYLKYAITVAKAGSLTKAAEELYVAQPNLSRSIKEFEKELGITIFDRNSKGIKLTADGELLIKSGKKILREIDEMEEQVRSRQSKKIVFAVSGPRAGYISHAFAEFTGQLSGENRFDVYYNETTPRRVISNITDNGYKMGIVRYPVRHDKFFKDILDEKELSHEMIAEFTKVLLVGKDSPLAGSKRVSVQDLGGFIEIAHADSHVPGVAMDEIQKDELTDGVGRKIFVFDRAVQFDILVANPSTFMWVSPVSEETAARYGLAQVECPDAAKVYKDTLVYPAGYKFTKLDSAFIDALCAAKRKYIG